MPDPVHGDLVEPPESPPVEIRKGLATYAGLAGAILPAAVAVLADDSIDEITKRLLLKLAAAVLITLMVIRGAQAVAADLARGRRASLPPA